jgi:hypothetical protein
VTAVLHELAHGFGFFGSGWMTANLQGTWGFGSASSGGVFPSIYDRFVVNGSGQAFLNTALFPNPSTALALQITGGNLFFNGANTRAMNFNMAARLYAPPAWASLASYSHLSELAYTTGDPNSLMTPLLSLGEAVHEPGGIVQGMFRDMGWSVNGSSCAYALGRTPSSFGAGGGTGTVNLGTGNNCVWTMSSNAPWLTFTSSTTGTGTTSVGFSVAANTSSVARLATISAGGESITVSQAGVGCAFTVGSNLLTFGVHGGSRSLPVTATAQDCAFTASTPVPWLTITGNRIGSSTLTIQATLSGSATRTATLNVAGTTVAVRQNGDSSSTFDIDDDGAADVLAYDPASGSRFFAAANPRDLGFTASTDALWAAGWSVYPGDFNGDRRGDLFFYNKTTGRALKAIAIGTETFSYTEFPWSPDWEITVADFNGDGADDVLTYNATTGRWFRCTSLPNGTFRFSEPGLWSPNWSIYPADFNGDGRADLFLYNATNDVNRGRWYRAVSNADESFGFIAGEIVWANNWTITPGDFNGDGRTDLFLYRSSGEWYRVFFTGAGTNYETGLWSPDWTLSRGDFNGDARTDLFVYNSTTGRWFVVISEANGSLSYHGGTVNWSAGWQISVTDIDVDGRADLVLYNPADGRWFQAITRTPGVFTFANGTWPTGLQIIATRPQPR